VDGTDTFSGIATSRLRMGPQTRWNVRAILAETAPVSLETHQPAAA
jgi:hypothetical protein